MTDQHSNHLQMIRDQLNQSPPKSSDDFILQLPKAGMLHASGQGFPKAWLKMAVTLLNTAGNLPGWSKLDHSLAEMLDIIFDMVDQASGEFLALGISQVQLSTFALEGLETEFLNDSAVKKNVHRSILEQLTELENKTSHTSLDADAVEHLKTWKEELPPVPEELMIPAVADILDSASLKLSLFMESAIHQLQQPISEVGSDNIIAVDFQRGSWVPEAAISAEALDDDGTAWSLTAEDGTTLAKVIHSREDVWNVEVASQQEVDMILLNGQPMKPFQHVPRLWTITTDKRPTQVSIHLQSQEEPLVFDRGDSEDNRYR